MIADVDEYIWMATMSRTDKDMPYKLRLEDAQAPKSAGRGKKNTRLKYTTRIMRRAEPRYDIEGIWSRFERVGFWYLREPKRSYGGTSIRESRVMCRQIARHGQKQFLKNNYDKYGWLEPEKDYEVPGHISGEHYYW